MPQLIPLPTDVRYPRNQIRRSKEFHHKQQYAIPTTYIYRKLQVGGLIMGLQKAHAQ